MIDEISRPDPDFLLLQSSERSRGKLKIYFGACAGVGKTYAMLQEAHRQLAQGIDLVVGVVETHGRSETASLQEGLPMLPRRPSGRFRYEEFDLDAALTRKPSVILMDELAHTNLQPARHPKRWQDIEELLNAGIDVITTVNVQHLESLNDVVGGITGIRVHETIPDPFFDTADEIVMVDLAPDDLHERLKEGKVYVGDRAERAIENFFRKGNLFALRELALRRTADRVDEQMQIWRETQGKEKVWHTRDAILLCIGNGLGSEKLVRTAARLAGKLGSGWHAVYVETPKRDQRSQSRYQEVLRALKLAQDLGAETAILSGQDEVKAIISYARSYNLGKIVTGRNHRHDRFGDRLIHLAPDLDLMIVACEENTRDPRHSQAQQPTTDDRWREFTIGSLVAFGLCALVTVAGLSLLINFDSVNLVMLYLLSVAVIALRYGRYPSVIATLLNTIAFQFFFVDPINNLIFNDIQYVVTFSVMLLVGIMIGSLTAGVRYQAQVAQYREQRLRYLYKMSKSLSSALSPQDIALTCQQMLKLALLTKSELLIPDIHNGLQPVSQGGLTHQVDLAIAKWSYLHGQPAGTGTDTLSAVPYQILPLKTGDKCYGLLVIEAADFQSLMLPDQQHLLKTFITLAASAFERISLTQENIGYATLLPENPPPNSSETTE